MRPLLLVLTLVLFASSVGSVDTPHALPPVMLDHDPINIRSDADFLDPRNGAVGLGTPENPYIIEGWRINSEADTALTLQSTAMHVLVRNCEFTVASRGAIVLQDAQNVRIENVTIRSEFWGIDIQGSDNVKIGDISLKSGALAFSLFEASSIEVFRAQLEGFGYVTNSTDIALSEVELKVPAGYPSLQGSGSSHVRID